MRPGRWPSRRGCAKRWASRCSRSGPTTASSSGCRPTEGAYGSAMLDPVTAIVRWSHERLDRPRPARSPRRRGRRAHRLRGRRGAGHRGRRRLGPVREPLPGERGAGPAAAAPPARAAHAALADAPARRRSCSPSPAATAPSRSSSRRTARCLQDVFDLPALRELLAAIERREVRVVSVETPRASPFALVAALRLHRHLHVRGRRPAARPARPGAGARPRPAARAARGRGAPRAARWRGAGRARARAPGAHRRTAPRARPMRSTTSCAGSAT